MDYDFKNSKTDTWINGKDLTFGYIGQTSYPMTGWNLYYISVELSGASEAEEDSGITDTGKYRWDLKDGTLVSTGEERNTATRDQGTTEDELFLTTRFSIEKPIELKHNRTWTLEWEMAGDWTIANSKLKKLFSEDGLKMTKNAEAIIIDPSGYITFGYYNGSTHLRIGASVPETVDITAFHKYKLENRVNADGSNMVYLIVDDVEIGAMDTPNKDGITKEWLVGNDFTFGFFGVNDEYFLDGGLINYIVVDEARGTEPEEPEQPEQPEEPTETRIKYRWELNADKNELVSVSSFGYTENALIDKVGSISDGVTSNLQYKFTTPVVLDHGDPWTVEWKMSGVTSSWQKVLVTQANALVKTDYCVMLKNETLSLGKYVSGHVNYNIPASVAEAGIKLADLHTYKLENRIDENGNNSVYLWVDNVEYGALTSSSGTWLPGTDITFNYIGQQKALESSTSYALKGAIINYIDIDLANAPEAVQPEEPENVFVNEKYRWDWEDNKLVSTGRVENALTRVKGSVENGFFSNMQYSMATSVKLLPTENWIVEWKMTLSESAGTGYSKLMTLSEKRQNGDISIMVNNAGVVLGYDEDGHTQYAANEFDASILTGEHIYRLQNEIAGDTNMVYLYVDNELVGPIDYNKITGKSDTFIAGKTIVLGYFGQANYPMNNVIIDNIRIQESAEDHVHSYDETVWVWTGDDERGYTDASAKFTCTCGDEQVVTDMEIETATTPATSVENGLTTYTASVEFGGVTYTDIKEVVIPANGGGEEACPEIIVEVPANNTGITHSIDKEESGWILTLTAEDTENTYVYLVKYTDGEGNVSDKIANADGKYSNGKFAIPEEIIAVTVESVQLGDVDLNGSWGFADYMQGMLANAGLKTFTGLNLLAADINQDGTFGFYDYMRMQLRNADLITKY